MTFRLADSLPQSRLRRWEREREEWLAEHPEPHDAETRWQYMERFSDRFHEWLDQGYGDCVLRRPDVRLVIEETFNLFDTKKYLLDDWVIMPNHLHAIVAPLEGWTLSSIMHSWKSYTASAINRMLGRSGRLWQKESYDHIIRTAVAHANFRRYIQNNPMGLTEGTYSVGRGAFDVDDIFKDVPSVSSQNESSPRQGGEATGSTSLEKPNTL